jgi:hypothetical protein
MDNHANTSAERQWKRFAEKLGRGLKRRYEVSFKTRPVDEITPQENAFQKAVATFPVPIKVMRGSGDGRIWTVIRHALGRPSTLEAEAVVDGKLDAASLGQHFAIPIETKISSLATYFTDDWDFVTTLVDYDVLAEPEKYADEFYRFLHGSFWDVIQRKFFVPAVNYPTKYNLSADAILAPRELLGYAQPLANVRTGLPPTIEEWQTMVASIVLIPQVPEAVQRTFTTAKRLFVFSYFAYDFSTASQHYAFLALEAAVQARWSLTLLDPCIVEFGNGTTTTIPRRTHKEFYQLWKADHRLKLNGRAFPDSMHDLLKSLKQQRVIKPWRVKLIEAGIELRNDLSHLEEVQITGASTATLSSVAEHINAMFDSVKLPEAE